MPFAHRIAALAGALALCASAAQASAVYQFTIDTSSIAGTTGFIELQFDNAGFFGLVQNASATISNFNGGGGAFTEADPYSVSDFPPFANVTPGVSGALPDDVVMSDIATNEIEDYLQGFTFGSSITFKLTLAGPAVDAPACGGGACSFPGFGIDLLAGDASQYLLSGDPLGDTASGFELAQVIVDAKGHGVPTINPGPDGGAALISVDAIPEPAEWALMLAGFGLTGGLLRSRRRTLAA